MGFLSCNAESAIATCDSSNWELLTKTPHRPFNLTQFHPSHLHSATNGFSSANLLGKGSHGYVYKAYLPHITAVKRTRHIQSADNEVEILSRVYHPRLVNLLGFAVDSDQRPRFIVVEYMPNGSLYDVLHGSGKPPGWVKRVRFALQVARAVLFLHNSNPPVIHRDIKSSNVLIDSEFRCRLGDFGLALMGHVEEVRVQSTPPAGTLGYLDPGYLAPGDLSAKSDVFSFGILMLEIISGRNAIDVNYSPPSVVDWAVPEIKSGNIARIWDSRIRPREDISEALQRMAVLAARCVRSTARKRPGMAEVVECLKGVYKGMKMPYNSCVSLGRCIGGVAEDSVVKYEALDEGVEKSRSGRRRKGNVSGVEHGNDVIGDGVGRSKSIGTAGEIKLVPSDWKWKARLSKSKSMGILRLGDGGPSTKFEHSKLLVDKDSYNI